MSTRVEVAWGHMRVHTFFYVLMRTGSVQPFLSIFFRVGIMNLDSAMNHPCCRGVGRIHTGDNRSQVTH